MSALNVTQDEADLLIASLNMYADVHKNASGVVPEDVSTLLVKLTSAPVVVTEPVVEKVIEAPKAKKAKVEVTENTKDE
jgi:hypothetical protein